MELILASKSERRRDLLNMFDVKHTSIVTDTDETVDYNCTPSELVIELSTRKANSALSIYKDTGCRTIIAADTVVSYNGHILGKPTDHKDARRMLSILSGTWHDVYTGVTVTDGIKYVSEPELTRVKFRNISDSEIVRYVEKYNPFDKAGAYGIQDGAGLFVERIEGDYYNVMGLPMCRLSVMLKEFGIYIN